MVFSDPSFVFCFLPLSIAILLVAPRMAFCVATLTLSFLFYWVGAGSQAYLLLFSVVVNWIGGLAIGRCVERGGGSRCSTSVLGVFVSANLAPLLYYKYGGFLTQNLGGEGLPTEYLSSLVLPIGISFFTFQGVSYLVDVYRGDVQAEPSPIRFGAYLSFFPQLIAGPIVRFKDVRRFFAEPRPDTASFAEGAVRFTHGLLKKVLIADGVAPIADALFALAPGESTFISAALGTLAYTIQIYFDFSGYSDMAIGLGLLFGVRFSENFLHPYSARSVTEFWRRWHVSLSTWFRDYVYVPLGGNRRQPWRTYLNLALVFLMTGLWHGAAWNFVAWGAYHGLFLSIERMGWGKSARQPSSDWLRIAYLFPVVCGGWVLFRSTTIAQAYDVLSSLTAPMAAGAWDLNLSLVAAATPERLVFLGLGLAVVALPSEPSIGVWLATQTRSAKRWPISVGYVAIAGALTMFLVMASDYSPFLYYRF